MSKDDPIYEGVAVTDEGGFLEYGELTANPETPVIWSEADRESAERTAKDNSTEAISVVVIPKDHYNQLAKIFKATRMMVEVLALQIQGEQK